ncbi:MAG: BlaI/MecI/CopY family transcriptional regulator [Bacteroidia bacterium]
MLKRLTPKEEEIMHILWKLGRGTVRDMIKTYDPPLPKYTTLSSAVRLLEERGFVGHKAYGRTHEYFALITKEEYKRFAFGRMVEDYFDNSYQQIVSFMAKEEKLSPEQIQAIQSIIDQEGEGDDA